MPTSILLDRETKGVFVEDICANTALINKMTDIAVANNLKASDADINETIHAIVATDKQHEYDKILFQKLFDYTSLTKYQNRTTVTIIARIKDLLTCLPHTYLCLCIDGYAGAISIENISEKTTIISCYSILQRKRYPPKSHNRKDKQMNELMVVLGNAGYIYFKTKRLSIDMALFDLNEKMNQIGVNTDNFHPKKITLRDENGLTIETQP